MNWRVVFRSGALGFAIMVGLAATAHSQTPQSATPVPPAAPPQFGEMQFGDVHVSLHGALSMGAALRAENPDSLFITVANGKSIGLPATGSNHNGDDSELNYGHAGNIYSAPLQGWLSLSATYNQYGLFVLGKGWYDFTELHSDVPWGNYPNGLTGGRPLSDTGFESRDKFSGLALQEAYVFGAPTVGDHNIYFRIGNQYIPWGIPNLFLGGLDALNPIDLAALVRPGATYADSLVPVPAVFLRFAVTPKLALEGFWQFAEARNAYPGCGTLFAVDYFPQGCNFALVASPLITDQAALLTGQFVTRKNTPGNNEVDQGGVGARYTIDPLNSGTRRVLRPLQLAQRGRGGLAHLQRVDRSPIHPGQPAWHQSCVSDGVPAQHRHVRTQLADDVPDEDAARLRIRLPSESADWVAGR